ncbi:glycosyltransferase family 2 protein [Polaribacter sp. IC073]|uniref:glycosyltransferase family 2 protein n=1 Tax=Polaribacter sp. IC073 TaxID=2508540 RepID=UPI0011BEC72B|nr:glycosyltransferase [Polaribacter sp. IC073]TXD48923.1 glycosyltransferase [Polaribacter sp. IC073]
MKISIIIALYNTEVYIEKCIRSIYKNNKLLLNEYEIIVINDGSTDNSSRIVENLKKEYANLQLLHKANGGQSTARNLGFAKAKGEYIFCLDSDDFIDADELIKALEYIEKRNLDILPIVIRKYDENYERLKDKEENYTILHKVFTGGDFMNKFAISGSMCRYLYKKSIISKHKLQLTEGIYHEDEEFVIKFMSYSKRVAYAQNLVYNQVVRPSSTVNNKNKIHRKKLLSDLLVVIDHLILHRVNFNKNSSVYKGITKKIEQLIISLFIRMKSDGLIYKEVKDFKVKLQLMDLYPIKIKELSVKFEVAAFFFNSTLLNKLYYK